MLSLLVLNNESELYYVIVLILFTSLYDVNTCINSIGLYL